MTSSNPTPKPPINEQLADGLLKLIMAGGLAGGGAGAFWSLFREDDLPKALASLVIGVGISYGASLLSPIHKGNRRRLAATGQAADQRLDRLSESAIATITALRDRYLACQAADCETYSTEGVGKSAGIFTPLLDEVFVSLELAGGSWQPGFSELDPDQPRVGLAAGTVSIWDLLRLAQKDRVYRQIAVLAWGGYGKTTLLRHVAYKLGKQDQPQGVPNYLPVLLLLRKYRQLLTQEEPPDLPTLIAQHHLPSLPVSDGVRMTPGWMKDQLRRGQVVVLLDGFDEVPKPQRPQVAGWLNRQMVAYGRSVFVLTARPKAYTEQTGAERLDFSTLLWVKDFQPQQRRSFIEKWYWCQEFYYHGKTDIPAVRQAATAAAQDLIRQIDQREALTQLAKNPLLLNMIALFHRRFPQAELPRRQVELYQEICRLQLQDRPSARSIETVLYDCDAQGILQRLA
ncbi:MAG: NACHT domain-containing protein, partial [Leptolyngbya sp. DLM2.Bin15]